MEKSYFFDEGIKFSCQRCGNCCTGSSGTIFVTSEEIVKISDYLKMDKAEFTKQYLYSFRDSFSLKEKNNFDCIFYQKGCLINEVKPNQCESYPFWRKSMCSLEKWQRFSKECPGIGTGKLYSKDELLEILENSVL